MLVSVIVTAIFVLIGKGMHVWLVVVADSRLVVNRRTLVLRRLMALRCPMLAALTVAGAIAGLMAGDVLQGRDAVVLLGLAHV